MKPAMTLLALIFPMIIGCVADSENLLSRVELGAGSLEIRYLETFGFAPHTVRFYYRKDGSDRLLAQTELANDGAVLGEQNFDVSELGDGQWLVLLKGQEQDDERWLIETVEGQVRMKRSEPAG